MLNVYRYLSMQQAGPSISKHFPTVKGGTDDGGLTNKNLLSEGVISRLDAFLTVVTAVSYTHLTLPTKRIV